MGSGCWISSYVITARPNTDTSVYHAEECEPDWGADIAGFEIVGERLYAIHSTGKIVSMKLDATHCVLTGDRAPITGSAKDDDGNQVNIVLKETDEVTIDGDKADMKGTATITSNPPGGKGLPCTVTFTTSGTRKK